MHAPGNANHRLILVIAAGCLLLQLMIGLPSGVLPPHAARATESGTFTGVSVLPDDGPAPFIDELEAANESILLYIYLLSDEEAIGALLRAHYRGVEVRVMLDPTPYGGAGTELEVYRQLTSAGIDVRWTSGAFRFAHVKMLIVDRQAVLIMNLNWTEAAFSSNREFAVVTNDFDRVAQAMAIFENDWHGVPITPAGPLVVSPETSRADLLGFIATAERTIDIYAEVMTDPEGMDAVTEAESRGVRVRLGMSQAADESLWHEEPGFLVRQGIHVRIMNRIYIHAKALIVDGDTAWIGSQNYTANSLDNNREVGTFVNDPGSLARIIAAFESDFAKSEPLAPLS
ncbi:hypothetical protein BH24CHL4_BH24CHL4_16000 [soil metagenome]